MFRNCSRVLREVFSGALQWRSCSSRSVSAMQPHMRRAVREITERLPVVDVVIEMRDARIPFTSANYTLTELVNKRPNRILLLNKQDLAHKQFHKETVGQLSAAYQHIIYTSKQEATFASDVLAAVRLCLPQQQTAGEVYVLMIVGTPNVGKTTLVNSLKRHYFENGRLHATRAGKLEVCDEPTLLLIDTPGIMLPRLKESIFAYRVALAGLVQEAQVSLQDLFAFTLYVLSQYPNKGQLKFVLSQPLLSDDGLQLGRSAAAAASNAHLHRSPQGALRHAYASKRFAKCILQGVEEAFQAILEDMESSEAEEVDTEPHTASTHLGQRADENVFKKRKSRTASQRPRYAHEHLSVLGYSPGLHSSGAQAQAGGSTSVIHAGLEGLSASTAGQTSKDNVGSAASPQVIECSRATKLVARRHKSSSPRPWMPYNSHVWAICANRVLSKVLKVDSTGANPKLQQEQVTSLMERIIRMARSGDFGPMVFEQPVLKRI